MPASRIETLIILGAGGDLTSRLLLPGLGSLLASSRGSAMRVIGVDRAPLTDARWSEKVARAFSVTPSKLGAKVAASSTYVQGDATRAEDLQKALDAATGRTAVYFALPPAVTVIACKE